MAPCDLSPPIFRGCAGGKSVEHGGGLGLVGSVERVYGISQSDGADLSQEAGGISRETGIKKEIVSGSIALNPETIPFLE